MRSISRIVGVNYLTVQKLMVEAGEVCDAFHHTTVRNVNARNI